MLINFSITNWMSFRDTATLTTIASKERQHGERLPRIKKYPPELIVPDNLLQFIDMVK